MTYEPEPLRRLLAPLSRTWPIGRLFGVEIRIHVLTLLVPLYALWSLGGGDFPGWFVASYVLGSIVVLYGVVLVHEFGHLLAARRFRMPGRLITLSPLGGLAHLEAPAPGPKAEIVVALAGPATNAAFLLLAKAAERGLDPSGFAAVALDDFAALNVGLLAFNLLPFFPLDGGRALRAVLALRLHANLATLVAATLGLVGGGALAIYGFLQRGPYGFVTCLIGLRCVETCLAERRAARFTDGPYATARDPWALDDDAWRGGRGDDAKPRRPGPIARLRARFAARAAAKDAKRREDARAEVDRLLDKVGAGGLASLTDAERARLKRASEELKRPSR